MSKIKTKFQPGDAVLIGDKATLERDGLHPPLDTAGLRGEVFDVDDLTGDCQVDVGDGLWSYSEASLYLISRIETPTPTQSEQEMKAKSQTFKKFDSNKPRFSLVPQEALDELISALEYGSNKYDEDPNNPNWVKGSVSRYMDAMMRHIMAHRRGEEIDPESQIKHLTLALTNLAFIVALNARSERR